MHSWRRLANCDTARAASDGQCAESEMTLRLIRTTLGRCGALRVYEHTVADTRQEVQTVTTWDEPGAACSQDYMAFQAPSACRKFGQMPCTAKRLSCRTRPSGDPSIPLREPLLSSRTTPRPVPPGTGGGRESCRRTQRTYRAAPARSLADQQKTSDKKAGITRNALANDSVGRQSTALALERLKRLARQAQGKR